MRDEELRALERRAVEGDESARSALERARERIGESPEELEAARLRRLVEKGELPPGVLHLAAAFGHAAARRVSGDAPLPNPTAASAWEAAGKPAAVRAALLLAGQQFARVGASDRAQATEAFDAATAWSREPTLEHAAASERAARRFEIPAYDDGDQHDFVMYQATVPERLARGAAAAAGARDAAACGAIVGHLVTIARFGKVSEIGLASAILGPAATELSASPDAERVVRELMAPRARLDGARLAGIDLSGRRLIAAELRGADLSKADLRGADLSSARLDGANLEGARLEGATLVEAQLASARLRGADLTKADLTRATLTGVDLGSVATLAGALLTRADLRGAAGLARAAREANVEGAILGAVDLRGADLTGAMLDRADLARAQLGGATLAGASFAGALLENADLAGSNLGGEATPRAADLTGARLAGASLERARLPRLRGEGADLTRARLAGADLRGATLPRARLHFADLSGARLDEASLLGADLGDANLAGASLARADLRGANLARARLDGADLSDARWGDGQVRGVSLVGAFAQGTIREVKGASLASLVRRLELALETLGLHPAKLACDPTLEVALALRSRTLSTERVVAVLQLGPTRPTPDETVARFVAAFHPGLFVGVARLHLVLVGVGSPPSSSAPASVASVHAIDLEPGVGGWRRPITAAQLEAETAGSPEAASPDLRVSRAITSALEALVAR